MNMSIYKLSMKNFSILVRIYLTALQWISFDVTTVYVLKLSSNGSSLNLHLPHIEIFLTSLKRHIRELYIL